MRFRPVLFAALLAGTAAVAATAAPACSSDPSAPAATRFSLSALGLGTVHATGVTRDSHSGHLWLLVKDIGLVETTVDGHYVGSIRFGTMGLTDYGFSDLAILDDGTFALTAYGDAYRYNPTMGTLSFYFCLVPGGPPIEARNDAVALDPASGRFFVAPAYYDTTKSTTVPINAYQAQYAASDGTLMAQVDVTATHVVAKGIAWDPTAQRLWVVEHGTIYRFTVDGQIDGQTALDGIGDAQGITLDGDRLLVLDADDDEIRVFDRAAVLTAIDATR